jgi:SOS response regulatory protein OraA/RecX
MIEIQLNEKSAENVKAIQELRAMGFSDEQIQKWYDNSQNEGEENK